MLKYLTEAEDDIKMDVQVGPQEEIESSPELNPVDAAKCNPDTVPVASMKNESTDEMLFYINASDISKLANLREMTFLEAVDEVIDCNEDAGMCPDNIVIVMDEGANTPYEAYLERNGANMMYLSESTYGFVDEADDESQESDINIDVQVGPNGDEMTVSEDPQEANPVDAVKREYDNVVVAKSGNDFFMDVEDVQKCAELNNESVIDAANSIIDAHCEDCDISADNIVFIVSEGTSTEAYDELSEIGARMVFEAASGEGAARKKIIKDAAKALHAWLVDSGATSISVSTLAIGGQNAKFKKGEGNSILLGISSSAGNTVSVGSGGNARVYRDSGAASSALDSCVKMINKKKASLKKALSDGTGHSVSGIRIQTGRLGVINVSVMFEDL